MTYRSQTHFLLRNTVHRLFATARVLLFRAKITKIQNIILIAQKIRTENSFNKMGNCNRIQTQWISESWLKFIQLWTQMMFACTKAGFVLFFLWRSTFAAKRALIISKLQLFHHISITIYLTISIVLQSCINNNNLLFSLWCFQFDEFRYFNFQPKNAPFTLRTIRMLWANI